jgi:hypothetical protein
MLKSSYVKCLHHLEDENTRPKNLAAERNLGLEVMRKIN